MSELDDLQSPAVTKAFLDDAENNINARNYDLRPIDTHPFDWIAAECLSKCFAVSRAALLLVESGFPDEAFAAVRSLVECSANLRYITAVREEQPARLKQFTDYALTERGIWYELIMGGNASDEEKAEAAAFAEENGIPNDSKGAYLHWSGIGQFVRTFTTNPHPLDKDHSTSSFKRGQRAIGYHEPSNFVHCTQPGLDNYFPAGTKLLIQPSNSKFHKTAGKTCVVIQIQLRDVIGYCFFGMGRE